MKFREVLERLNNNDVSLERLRVFEIEKLGAEALGNALKTNHILKAFDLQFYGNNFVEILSALSEGLKVNQSLRKLDLSANHMEEDAATVLADILSANRGLEALYLEENHLGEMMGLRYWPSA